MTQRAAGILLHPSSLPSPYGIGTLGAYAERWIDRLATAGVRYWQILPLGPTGLGNSPYQCYSAFAGEPMLIDLDRLAEEGLLAADELPSEPFDGHRVQYDTVAAHHAALLKQAQTRFKPHAQYTQFCAEQARWLEEYALFMALREYFNDRPWTEWPAKIRLREPETIAYYGSLLREQVDYHRFVQYCFFSQWKALKSYAERQQVSIIGDLPIYVAMNSADVWADPQQFLLDEHLHPTHVSGVPPDYFSATGQRWGNPLFDWERMAQDGYAWWVTRLRMTLQMFDWVRIDHFRGFEAYWSIPADEQTAINGEWVEGPGGKLFDAFQNALGDTLPIIAEDLGIITSEVEKLRDDYGLPGMKILQFAFGDNAANPYLPHNHIQNCVVYTGTHDNDTTNGWFYAAAPEEHERSRAMQYLSAPWEEFHKTFNRTALASTANLAILPLQDLLGLGSDARMNTPGTTEGNWAWRVTEEQLEHAPWQELRSLCELYGRA